MEIVQTHVGDLRLSWKKLLSTICMASNKHWHHHKHNTCTVKFSGGSTMPWGCFLTEVEDVSVQIAAHVWSPSSLTELKLFCSAVSRCAGLMRHIHTVVTAKGASPKYWPEEEGGEYLSKIVILHYIFYNNCQSFCKILGKSQIILTMISCIKATISCIKARKGENKGGVNAFIDIVDEA